MIIESVELKNFRNYKSLQMDFDKGTNILYGDNAQGKPDQFLEEGLWGERSQGCVLSNLEEKFSHFYFISKNV